MLNIFNGGKGGGVLDLCTGTLQYCLTNVASYKLGLHYLHFFNLEILKCKNGNRNISRIL